VGEGARREGADESVASRSHLRDLVALLALPALWKEKDPERIAGDLLDVLVGLLRLDCAFVRLTDVGTGEMLDQAWPESSEITQEVASALQATEGSDAASLRTVAAPAPGGGMMRLVRVEQRLPGEDCVVLVGARRASFPTTAEGFLLQVAADQAAIAVHGARLLAREQAAREDAELRAAQMALAAEVGAAVAGAAELDGMLRSCADAMARNLGAPCAGIWTAAEGQVLVLRARGGECAFSARYERVPIGAYRVGRIARQRRPHLTNHVPRDPLTTDPGWAGRNRLTAFAGYPLVVEDRLLGVMAIYADRPLAEQALDLMGSVADMIATGIERKRVEEERSRLASLERKARAEADAERARLRSLIRRAPVPIAALKGPDHVFELANEPLCALTGRRDLVGNTVREAFPALQTTPHLDDAFRTGAQVVVDEHPLRVERNGRVEEAVYKFVIDPYRDSAGAVEGLVVVGVEVTAEVAAHRTVQARAAGLAHEQEWLESLLDILPVGVVLIEPGTAKVLLSNKAADRTAGGVFPIPRSSVGASEDFYCTDALGKRLPEDEMPGVRAARGEKLRALEVDWHTPGGTTSLLINSDVLEAAHGHQATVVSAFEDVTELKSTQVALSLALEDSYRFVSVVEESSEFMGIATLQGQVVFLNSAGQKLVGVEDPARIPRMTIFDYVFPEDHGLLRETIAAAIAEGQRTGELRFRKVGRGEPIPVWANVFVLRDRRTDQPVALATVIHDLTEQKRNLELRERVLGIVSHDLRNPLNAIMMGASVMRREPRASRESVRIASRIVASAERMDAIIGDLLDLTKVRLGGGIELKLAKADAHELSARVVEELRAANPGREIRLRTVGDATGRWDTFRLEQVVSNLASNALQYGPEEAPVTVESQGHGPGWTLSVHNLGEPIPPELLPHLFDPFRRGEGPAAGKGRRNLGLGLFIVRAVVEAHGGTIDVTSAPGQGTRFTASLPRFPPG
jgi:PAS domain S-box-containing protein